MTADRRVIVGIAVAMLVASSLPHTVMAEAAEPAEPEHPIGTILEALDEPGTWTVSSDAHAFGDIRAEGIEIDDVGAVWLSSYAYCAEDPQDEPVSCVWRPGVPGYSRHPVRGPEDSWEPSIEDFAVTPDGTVWAASYRGLDSFDGSAWVLRSGRGLAELDVGPDGRVWGAGADGDLPPFLVGIVDDEPARFYGGDPDGSVDGWNQATVRFLPLDVAATADGAVWVGGVDTLAPDETWDGFLVRFDGADWESMQPVSDIERFAVASLAAGPDGSLWAVVLEDSERYLAHRSEGAWSWISEADGLPADAGNVMEVGADGKVWLASEGGGIVAFDGSTWTQYLGDAEIYDLAVGRDGSIWAAGEGLYVVQIPS